MIDLVEGKKHQVIKRDGRVEVYNEEKMKKVLEWAINKAQEEHFGEVSKGLTKQMVDEVLQDTKIKIYDKIHISKLFDEIIKTCENKINRLQPIWDKVAKNLLVQKYYKEVWGIKRDEYPDYLEVVKKGKQYNVKPYVDIYENFIEDEIKELGNYIKPERDFGLTSLGIKSFMSKYALRHTKNKWLELPQHTYMRLAIKSFINEDKSIRLDLIKKRYDHLSQSYFSEATPRYNDTDMEASCVLIKMGDDSWSITRTVQAVGLYSKHGGGTAVDVSDIRAIGSRVGVNGESDGVIPFIKMVESAISGFKQGGNKRRGACAVYFNWWHYEVEDLVMLKDEGGNEDKRARNLQYGIKLNRLFLDRVVNDKEITLFDPKETSELLNSYGEEFEKWYLYYENKNGIKKKKIKARDLAYLIAKVRLETGNLYIFLDENVNENKPFEDYVSQSNLCVAPETKILTDKGYQTISELKDQWVKIWNGKYFEEAYVAKTNDNAKLIKVETTGGTIECTPYHKFYVQQGFSEKGKVIEKRAGELKVGDKLIKFDLPVIEGGKELELAYENGFYSGDGCEYYKTRKAIYLYDKKRDLLSNFRGYYHFYNEYKRITLFYKKEDLKDKFFVPNSSYTIQSRLEWFAGLLDSDGTLTKNENTQSFQLGSINYEFLQEVLLMLQTLGVTAKLTKSREAGKYLLPKNNGTGALGYYNCKAVYRLLIGEGGVQKLLNLGLGKYLKRLKPKIRKPNRNAEQFIKVIAIIDEGRYDETYCFNAPETHMGMFNGLNLGQCSEITLPTKPSYLKQEQIVQKDFKDIEIQSTIVNGEIALCNLSSINVVEWFNLTEEQKDEVAYLLLRSHDNLIENAFYPIKEGEIHNKLYRPIGIGITNLAYYMAKNRVKMSSDKALKLQFDIMEDIYFYLYKNAIRLAKERGRFERFNRTKWKDSWLPIDMNYDLFLTYACRRQYERWEDLRTDIKNYGIRFSTIGAIAPTASSALVMRNGSTESVNLPKSLIAQKSGGINGYQLASEFWKYGQWYELQYEVSNEQLLKLAQIRQLFLDQAQSVDLFYTDYSAFEVIKDIIMADKLGVKTLYYANSKKDEEKEICESCSS